MQRSCRAESSKRKYRAVRTERTRRRPAHWQRTRRREEENGTAIPSPMQSRPGLRPIRIGSSCQSRSLHPLLSSDLFCLSVSEAPTRRLLDPSPSYFGFRVSAGFKNQPKSETTLVPNPAGEPLASIGSTRAAPGLIAFRWHRNTFGRRLDPIDRTTAVRCLLLRSGG